MLIEKSLNRFFYKISKKMNLDHNALIFIFKILFCYDKIFQKLFSNLFWRIKKWTKKSMSKKKFSKIDLKQKFSKISLSPL